MKKLSLALAALLVLTMFASCKKTGDDPKTSGSSSSEPTSSSVKDSTEAGQHLCSCSDVQAE